MENHEIASWAAALVECGDALSKGGPGAPLRRLQTFLRGEIAGGSSSSKTLAFLIDEWIRDYYLNFAGDLLPSASEEVERIRGLLMSDRIGPALSDLGKRIDAGSVAWFSSLEAMIVAYLDAVSEANKATKGSLQ
jgi:hypothetical protein